MSERHGRRRSRKADSSLSSSSTSSTSSRSSSSSSSSSSSDKRKSHSRKHRHHYRKPVDHSKNVRMPAFDGHQKQYREYRRAVKRYAKLVGKEGTGLALQLNLQGEALEITRHLSARRLKEKTGVRLLLNTLDDEYLGLQEDRLDEVAEEFVTCRRSTGESMSRYIRRLKEARKELEDEEPDMYVSEKFFAWMLLRRAGLTTDEKSRVRSTVHCSEDPRDLAFALKRLFPSHKTGLMAQQEKRNTYPTNRGGFRSALLADVPEGSDSEESGFEGEDLSVTEDDDGTDQDSLKEPMDVLAAMEVVKQAEKDGLDVYAMYKSAKAQQRGKAKVQSKGILSWQQEGFRKGQSSRPDFGSSAEGDRPSQGHEHLSCMWSSWTLGQGPSLPEVWTK